MQYVAHYKPWQCDHMHAYSFERNIESKHRPGFLQRFGSSDNENMNIGMDVKDLSEGLWILYSGKFSRGPIFVFSVDDR